MVNRVGRPFRPVRTHILEELMMMLEQEFGVEWTEEDLNRLETVADLTAFVEEQI